jgi:hypothetical protein
MLEDLLVKSVADKTAVKSPVDLPAAAAAVPANAPRIKMNALVLSDSIFRHVAGECPKRYYPDKCDLYDIKSLPERIDRDINVFVACQTPKDDTPNWQKRDPITVKKVCIPGADCQRLYLEAVCLAQVYEFEHVYCHVGTNLHDQLSAEDSAVDISRFLAGIKETFKCAVTYSPILPRLRRQDQRNPLLPISEWTTTLLWALRRINADVYKACEQLKIGTLVCDAFIMDHDEPVPDRSLLAQDGCHLSKKGVVEMEKALIEHIKMSFWESMGETHKLKIIK